MIEAQYIASALNRIADALEKLVKQGEENKAERDKAEREAEATREEIL